MARCVGCRIFGDVQVTVVDGDRYKFEFYLILERFHERLSGSIWLFEYRLLSAGNII